MKIEIKNVNKVINKVEILKDVSANLESGKIYGFVGINGSGKTMLMRCICGLILPSLGEVSIDGEIIGKDIDFPRSVGVLIENPGIIPYYNGFENLKEISSIKGKVSDDRIREVLEEVGLDPDDKRKVRKYSLGMKQKLGIALAFLENPDLIIIDEPYNALDTASREKLTKMIMNAKNRGALVIVSCHDQNIIDNIADEIVEIENGEIINVKTAIVQ